ncbi:inner membrane protein YhjD [Corynebacterium sp. 3HC-13]|uniref:YhjD/YihY/BrkB family envelope integrity protein n=1 Tax=Corynebacterium poyangense TaxID=2684405 RepID=UPI001CC962E4|nr:YhjD/YihY/BrkB family envelope integrity protein [Corynebacterium poyangense]MBZ8176814.1 inner membrane protein YhjD [Corynebacterium poyangense]
MAASTQSDRRHTDVYGIERVNQDNLGFVDKLRERWDWFDHIMLMQERYSAHGGNQYSAGITYFSVLAIFPILMLVFASLGFVLAANPDRLNDIQNYITGAVDGDMSEILNQIIETAIKQRGTVAGLGALTTLWSGLGWMNNLRYGVSKMWRLDPTDGNFAMKKLLDLLGLLGLLISFVVAFGITAVGSSGLTTRLIEMVGLENIPGINIITTLVAILLGLVANFLVMLWMIMYLPRTKVPPRSGVKAAILGAFGFEVIKQLGSLFFSNALSNPAGAAFGPIIGLMVVLYLVWRIVLYCSAWAATTEESLQLTKLPAPEPAVIRVRQDINHGPGTGTMLGIGAGLGAIAAGLAALLRR